MPSDTIKCPECGTKIEVADLLKKQIASEIEKDIDARIASAKEKGAESARKDLDAKLREVSDQLAEEQKKREQAQQEELTLRKKQRELEEAQKNLELDVARKIDEERKKIEEATHQRLSHEHSMREAEKDKKLTDAMRQIEDMKRKLEQGSQQAQGEVMELEFENALKRDFPHDEIEPVAKGVKGGDVLQTVRMPSGTVCGKIIWEMKRTKTFSEGWIQKLKDDAREAKAQIPVLVSEALPSGFKNFKMMEGVWVTEISSMMALANVLRITLIEVTKARDIQAGKKEKMEMVYDYLMGPEFKARVTAIVETYRTMQEDLEAEKRATQRIWEKRAKQIEKAVANTAGFCGELEGFAGSAELGAIKILELPGA